MQVGSEGQFDPLDAGRATAPIPNGDATNEASPWTVTRRQVLGGAGAISLAAAVLGYEPDALNASAIEHALLSERPHNSIVVQPAVPSMHFSMERPDDLVLLDFTFHGFTVVKGPKFPSLVATTAKTVYNWIGVVIQFPPQAIGEADYSITQTPPQKLFFDPTPVMSQVAGPSRLAFTFNHGDKIPLPTGTIADLIDFSGWKMNVTRAALTGTGATTAAAPLSYQTSIECPRFLYLSPVVDGIGNLSKGTFSTRFENRSQPFRSSKQVVECWTTSLNSVRSQFSGKLISSTQVQPYIAPVWADDFPAAVAEATPQHFVKYSSYIAPPK